MPNHTPEPWQQHDNHPMYGPDYDATVWGPEGPGHGLVADFRFHANVMRTSCPEDIANAKRAVACVNACEGIDDPAAALVEVREVLRATLEHMGAIKPAGFASWEHTTRMMDLRAALALLGKGGAS